MELNQKAVDGVIAPINTPPATPEEAAKGHRTVTMVFDTKVHLTTDTNKTIMYHKGVHEVPEHLADHWYLKAHGVRPYARPLAVGELSAPKQNIVTGVESLSREDLMMLAKGFGISVHPRIGTQNLIDKITAAKAGIKSAPDAAPADDAPSDAGEAGDKQ